MPRSWSERFGFGSEEESPAVNNFEERINGVLVVILKTFQYLGLYYQEALSGKSLQTLCII